MSDAVIAVENLSKRYLVAHQSAERRGYTALRDVIGREVRNFARKAVDVVRGQQIVPGDEVEEFWALKNVSFEVKQGEVLGIIGRNGAGKSTLLKILSRITEPDGGRAILRGRIASLLEVGTGFHPELTGRENIFLNGAILGMKRAEIKRKFDEIVAFADVERFLDTPVKRYSSGMYARLAFSVAAHLEPEILVVDEVLAVGDGEFQRKCLGKMSEAAQGGRTVLFVSHNMAAVKSLTTHGILLDAGRIVFSGATEQLIEQYRQLTSPPTALQAGRGWGKGKHTAISQARLLDKNGESTTRYIPGEPLRIEVVIETDGARGMSLELFLTDSSRMRLGLASTYQFHGQTLPEKKGTYRSTIVLEPLWLATGNYTFDVATSVVNVNWDHSVESAVEFEVQFSNALGYPWDFKQSKGYGFLTLLCNPTAEFVSVGESGLYPDSLLKSKGKLGSPLSKVDHAIRFGR
jgi:lipopolysaccharide transport system ATP-binding protein